MKRLSQRQKGDASNPDIALSTEPKRMLNPWVEKLGLSYQQVFGRFTRWVTGQVRHWERQTTFGKRRRQVLAVFVGLVLLGIGRLFYLFQQPTIRQPIGGFWMADRPPGLTSSGPTRTGPGRSALKIRMESSQDSIHAADYHAARLSHKPSQSNAN